MLREERTEQERKGQRVAIITDHHVGQCSSALRGSFGLWLLLSPFLGPLPGQGLIFVLAE